MALHNEPGVQVGVPWVKLNSMGTFFKRDNVFIFKEFSKYNNGVNKCVFLALKTAQTTY